MTMEFHISRAARDKYQFDQMLFSTDGNVIFANFQAARRFAQNINSQRSDPTDLSTYVSPGQINALGLIDEIFHWVIKKYYQENASLQRHSLFIELQNKLGSERLNETLVRFTELFPPVAVYKGQQTAAEYLSGSTNGISNTELVLEEMLTNWLANANPAAIPYHMLFDETELSKGTAYDQVVDGIQIFFKHQPPFGPGNQDLVTMLRTPAIMVPQSLTGQLEYIRVHWAPLLGDYLLRILGSLDMIKEENRAAFTGPGPTLVPDYRDRSLWGDSLSEIERYSLDSDWMPKVVMIAKNSYVWLNQLSRQYQRPIERLDQIPDETLDELARWGFTGLWLIGLWERSDASRRIKQLCGNPDAVSSAYSLCRYQIADRLGGELAYADLNRRCAARGIRLASDMVPNHMGIDSDWVYDHPDWFISLDHSPFPSYTFNGPDLSQNPRISINLEDHYYSRSDAAVVFKRYDHETGREQFVYHGNDGTSMPWNDTAQLNYLNPEVREAVIQTILSVAHKFPIIRFDAAMTLTKKHYQRLWFPQPGSGGDIPSRADFAMTKETFDSLMPEEFWREVVERVAKEAPDTLLLAEAFWLMEGYFVRSLGMHRVYNSAFMNMLRNEENDKYRQLIKNTLVYDPGILKRYVNFMNNPDEKTAVEQFGKGDKYFGICTLLATMPGLPMFGHGQIEGYSEKYGMEYYRPYWDETPDSDLVRRHQSDIFPLLHRRWLFAGVENFLLYDFHNSDGSVNEAVFAYSNCQNGQAALVVYNNCIESAAGWIKVSAPYLVKTGENSHLQTKELFEGLQLDGSSRQFVTFRDAISKLTYIRPLQELREKGMFFSINGYAAQVLMDFKVVEGQEFERLNTFLAGRGVYDFEATRRELALQPILTPLHQLLQRENLEELLSKPQTSEAEDLQSKAVTASLGWLRQTGKAAQEFYGKQAQLDQASLEFENHLKQLQNLEYLGSSFGISASPKLDLMVDSLLTEFAEDPRKRFVLLMWAIFSEVFGPASNFEHAQISRKILEETPVSNLVTESLKSIHFGEYEAYKNTQALKWMMTQTRWALEKETLMPSDLFESWIKDPEFVNYLEVNTYNEIRWFNKEKFEQMVTYQKIIALLYLSELEERSIEVRLQQALSIEALFSQLSRAAESSEYQLDKLLSILD